ncbi:hypothetical protein MauCBS54593_005064 [Microsporum audouinii]
MLRDLGPLQSAAIFIIIYLQDASATPIDPHIRADSVSPDTLLKLDSQPGTCSENIGLQRKEKLLIGLCAGLGGLLLLSAALYLIMHKKMWYRKLLSREKACRKAEDNGTLPSTHHNLPCHPLYREGIRAASTQMKLTDPQTPTRSSPFTYHPYQAQQPNSYYQPVEVYRALMVPDELLETPIRPPRCSEPNLASSVSSQGRRNAVDITAHPVPITHPAQLPIYSPQPRRVGLPVSPKLQ